jgi:putative tricarboxylic transport membrane protein
MKSYDKICSLIFFVSALAVGWLSFQMPLGNLSKPGPGLFPLSLSTILALLSVLLWIETRLVKSSRERIESKIGERQSLGLLLTIGSLLAYALLLEFVGFVICTLVILFVLFHFVGKQKWWAASIGSILVTLFSHLVFRVALHVQLPAGLFQ